MCNIIVGALVGCFALVEPSESRASSEDEARAFIKKLGGTVTIDEKRPGRPVVAVNL
jgi:hypothetical protein